MGSQSAVVALVATFLVRFANPSELRCVWITVSQWGMYTRTHNSYSIERNKILLCSVTRSLSCSTTQKNRLDRRGEQSGHRHSISLNANKRKLESWIKICNCTRNVRSCVFFVQLVQFTWINNVQVQKKSAQVLTTFITESLLILTEAKMACASLWGEKKALGKSLTAHRRQRMTLEKFNFLNNQIN